MCTVGIKFSYQDLEKMSYCVADFLDEIQFSKQFHKMLGRKLEK